MQIDKLFTAIWHNTTTWPWTPLTGLSATITIRDKSTNTIVVNNEAMTEIGLGEYDYTFTAMDWAKAYSYVMSPNVSSAYIVSGFVDPRMANLDKNLSQINGWWYRSWSDFNAQDRKYIKDTHDKVQTLVNTDISWIENILNEIDSQNEIANQNIIDTIKEIEKDICKDINKESIATRQLVRQKAKKQEEYIQKQLDSEAKTQEMIENEADEIEEQIEKNLELEIEQIEKQINSQIDKEIEEIESNLPNNGNNNGTES